MAGAVVALTLCAIIGIFVSPPFAWVWSLMAGLFGCLGVLRFLACLIPFTKVDLPHGGDELDVVPIWTLLIALYDEADSVPSLLAALGNLQWDASKLDIIFACEHDDKATLDVLCSLQTSYQFRIVRVPKGGPRTKPNALQTALPFALGRFVTVYDAEDRPDPSQLRAAFHAFANGPPDLAVVQAPLVAWNHDESWISQQFALDYAIWFRVVLPALARLSGVLPLGGTSNHFRADALKRSGGWDPYNVTEDADLGIRLSRLGYRASVISPPTLEEAPPRVSAWIRQRGRWIQGHIQTLSVHGRQPISLAQGLGWRGLFAMIIGIGIGPLSAVFMLPMTACLLVGYASGTLGPLDPAAATSICLGLISHLIACWEGARRDGRLTLMAACITSPLYFCLQSVSACRAMWRVVFTPSFWDKTDHGCAARSGARAKN